MNALRVRDLRGGNWLYELKFDGYRALAFKAGREVRLVSRNRTEGSRKYFGALPVGYYGSDGLLFAGRVGTGFSERVLVTLYEGKRTSCPFINLPETRPGRWGLGITPAVMKRCRWVEPILVAQIKFTEWTSDDQLRQPVFLGLRTDKQAKDVVRE